MENLGKGTVQEREKEWSYVEYMVRVYSFFTGLVYLFTC